MRILITGASGLIGGRLVEWLLARGDYEIRAASRRARAWPTRVRGVLVDYAAPESFSDAVAGVDAVVNLAAAGERAANADPLSALRSTAGGTLTLASSAAHAGVGRYVQLSTSKVYGSALSGRITEDTPTRPRSHYAIAHRAAEDYVTALHENAVILRLANGFGAPVDPDVSCWDTIVNGMCRQAVVEARVGLASSGQGWRNFVPMNDITAALEAGATHLPAGTYNLGSDCDMRLVDMAQLVSRIATSTMGVTPAVTTEASDSEPPVPALKYCHDKLDACGVPPTASAEEEIARTLRAARMIFGTT